MKVSPRSRRPASPASYAERGYILITLILFVALLAISLAVLAPEISQQVKRDREEELVHRGVQYSRAIKHYVKKFGRYPTKIEDLENTNNLRFLRKRYKDPITGKDFKILHMGEVRMGFGGGIGAIPGSPAAAIAAQSGAFGNNGAPSGNNSAFGGGNSAFGGNSGAFGGNGGSNGGAFGNGGVGGNNSSFGGNGGSFGGTNSAFGGNAPGGNTNGAFGGATSGTNSAPAPGADAAQTTPGPASDESPVGVPGTQPGNGQLNGQPGSAQGTSTPGQGNPVFGGGPMVGVASTSKDKTIRVFNKKEHYDQWQFIYDPSTDRGGLLTTPNQPGLQNAGAGSPIQGIPGSQPGNQGGTQNPSSSFGSQSSFGSFGAQPQPGGMQPTQQPPTQQPTQPQQEFPPDQGP